MAKKNPYPIPSSFELGGMTWTVEELDVIPGAMGATDASQYKVVLLKALPPDIKFQTFLHELVHCIMFSMGRTGDTHDEVFVDGFATFFMQFLKTAK